MKNANTKKMTLVTLIVGVAALGTGCGSASPAGAPIAGIPGGVATGGCIPLSSQPIGFSATGIYYNGISVIGGNVPGITLMSGQSIPASQNGQVVVTSGGVGGMFTSRPGSYDGSISMNITSAGGVVATTSPAIGSASATGTITISPARLQTILQTTTYGSTLPGMYPTGYSNGTFNLTPNVATGVQTQACVSGVAFNLLVNTTNQLYFGGVILYLNNTQHGTSLSF